VIVTFGCEKNSPEKQMQAQKSRAGCEEKRTDQKIFAILTHSKKYLRQKRFHTRLFAH
jgi:hypothetical protein